MSTKPSAAASGAIGAAVNVAGSDILPQAGQVYGEGSSLFGMSQNELNQYLGQLQGELSTNPATRMESNVAQIGDITSLAQGEKASILSQPRSGAQAYELASVDQNTATAIGNALSASFLQAQKELGQLGEFTTTTGLGTQAAAISAEEGAAATDISAGGQYTNLAPIVAAGDQATLNSIISGFQELGTIAMA